MAHVGVQSLSAGDAEEHAAEDKETGEAVVAEEGKAVEGVDGGEHGGMLDEAA